MGDNGTLDKLPQSCPIDSQGDLVDHISCHDGVGSAQD